MTAVDYTDLTFHHWGAEQSAQDIIAFIPEDISCVSKVRDFVEAKCKDIDMPEDYTFELALISDELVANAIVASHEFGSSEFIIFRWIIRPEYCSISVLDYGGGFNLPDVNKDIPEGENLTEFLASVQKYRETTSVEVPHKGKIVQHMRFGRGLRIVTGLVDDFRMLFHDNVGNLSPQKTEITSGTIVAVRYNLVNRKPKEAFIEP